MFKRVTSADLVTLTRLDYEIFGSGGYSEAQWADELNNADIFIAFQDNRPVGFISAVRLVDETEVRKIGLIYEFRRRGIAKHLLASVIHNNTRVHRVIIDVAADNNAGVAFYKNLGFTEIARRKKYYAHGADAIVMTAQGHALHKIMSAV